jgi:hypothetical protein
MVVSAALAENLRSDPIKNMILEGPFPSGKVSRKDKGTTIFKN